MAKLKVATLRCSSCKRTRRFTGRDVKEILAKIDASGWVDYPSKEKTIAARCPRCYAAWNPE